MTKFAIKVVGEIYVKEPVLNFVQGKHKNEDAKADTANFKDVIKRMSIYVTGTNLHYFKSMSGDTPEIGGLQFGAFPVPKTFTIGLNVTF